MKFRVHATDGAARAATLSLAHGEVETPVFMPVGTYGAVKAVSPAELAENGTRIVLGNTFHLWLRPGLEVIAAHGGLHRFIGWSGPILTDSGGYQVFSLGELRRITEEGVRFASPVNGDRLLLTPEESMRIQRVLDGRKPARRIPRGAREHRVRRLRDRRALGGRVQARNAQGHRPHRAAAPC